MKKLILPVIVIIIFTILIVIVKIVNFADLTMNIIEKTANVDINYRTIVGNIFQGYRIDGYNVKISDTDSIFGEIAEIRYHFKPFVFRLPSLFQINLIEPTVCLTQKKEKQKDTQFNFLRFNLGLRITIKNGKVVYKDEKSLIIENISGLVFLDFVGNKLFLNTINLSLRSKDYPIHITSANLNVGINSEMFEVKSFAIKGNGISLNGEGVYHLQKKQAFVKFKSAYVNLETIGVHSGSVHFSGEVEYEDGKLLPRIQGTTDGVYPFDRFAFETTPSGDTVWVNIFDGTIFGGVLFAQLKYSGLKNIAFEANFNNINLGNILGTKHPLIINGYVGYRDEKFIGHINSPSDRGLDIDSLFIYGSATQSHVTLDSLFVKDGEKILEIKGTIYKNCKLNIIFNNFDLSRFRNYAPIEGVLNGQCSLSGRFTDPRAFIFTADIKGNNFSIDDLTVEQFTLQSRQFQLRNPAEYLMLTLKNVSFKNWNLNNSTISIRDSTFTIQAHTGADSLDINGSLDNVWQGVISSLYIQYHGVKTQNIEPISFDILHKRVGEIYLSFIGGTLRVTLKPLRLELSQGNLEKLGLLLGIKDSMSGELQLFLGDKKFSITAQDINYLGMINCSLKMLGDIQNNVINIETLTVSDENNQNIYVHGLLSREKSDVFIKFTDVGVWVLPFLHNFMSNPGGLLSGEGMMQGTIDDFKINGKGVIKNGSFVIDVISAQFDSVESNVKVEDNHIIFESGKSLVSSIYHVQSSRASKSAWVTAGGVVKLEPRFKVQNLNFDFSFKDAPIQFLPFVFGTGSGNFSVGMKNKIAYYNGNITVKEGIVPIDFGLKTKQEKGNDNWTMNLKIRADRNIWLRNREADIEFGGELYVIKEHTPLYLSGTLETHRGNFYWLNHILSITSGKVTFIPEEEIDPELDIWAEMNTREGIKIILHCFGPLSEPIFEFFTDPAGRYSEQDIITYLSLNITWQELESMKGGDYVGKILPQSILLWLESDVTRRIRQYTGLDYFVIEGPFLESEETAKLTVGKYISKDLFITYTYGITTFSNEFNVEYFIDDKNEIVIRRDEEGEYSLQYQYRIRF
jgi:hypothetical protein